MGRVSLCFVFGLSLSLGACSTFEGYPDPPVGGAKSLKEIDGLLYEALQRYSQESDPFIRQEIRNSLTRQRMVEIDFSYQQFEQNLHAENVRGSVYTDWASTALTAAIPATGSTHSKNVLSGLSTVLTTSKTTYDNKVLMQATMPALVSEMRASRAWQRADILKKLNQPVNSYDIYAAWSDLNDYYLAGTLPGAISALNSAASSKRARAEHIGDAIRGPESLELNSVLATPPTPPMSAEDVPSDYFAGSPDSMGEEAVAVTPDGVTAGTTEGGGSFVTPPTSARHIPSNVKGTSLVLQTWLDKNAGKNIPLLMGWLKQDPSRPQVTNDFLYKSKHEALRQQAITELKVTD
ncbi:MAG: hypothetical protein PHE17_13050 [Thiothrix sp.]|uniref:hypothetical protein n=1 Tax=Thiothrix sp. TaxID=1032 RepID=UPI00260EE8F4|nr:hypothetical protein [Thiothrix sp.]MDD5393940.1 hypothetical protein [Thiothrix sp.]